MADATPLLHLFRAGTYVEMGGRDVTITAADLAACARAYDPARHEAPLVAGHPTDNGPALGWVASLSARGEDLEAQPRDIDPALAAAVKARRYAKLSASFWPPAHPANPAPGVWSLRHVGFLGAAVPAVLGLRPIALAADDAALITLEFAAPAADPTPEASMPDPTPAASATDPTVDFAAREAALSAREAELTTATEAIAAREAALDAQAEQARRAEIASFIGVLVSDGRVLPVDQAPLVALLSATPPAPAVDFAAPVTTGEPQPRGGDEWLREFLARLPKQVEYGEFAGSAKGTVDAGDREAAAIEAAARHMAGLPPADI
ncbi:hypothetical protein [Thiocystis violascens]|uniref:Mu-like prophage I protein n=1 Tax=Thiocystis violascens (strain ATCC 17096 / DSM 198 / 6111) TaxID=765911 RepID=I3YEH8_THIV6|nr:hypothetical protein [Thiocystis violascens]AFL75396.1 hypothetical protein Thivi_3529 [Thiocystis violascens DSM 198]